jgi:hypothetical protein
LWRVCEGTVFNWGDTCRFWLNSTSFWELIFCVRDEGEEEIFKLFLEV